MQNECDPDSGLSYDGSEVIDHLLDNRPPPQFILEDTFFSKAQFPLALAYDIAELYGFGRIAQGFLQEVKLNESEWNSKRIMIVAWLVILLDVGAIETRTRSNGMESARGVRSFP